MSQLGPPPGGPSLPRSRPRVAWFGVGALLLVAAAACIAFGVIKIVDGVAADAIISANGEPQIVVLDNDDERMLFAPRSGSSPTCRVRTPANLDVTLGRVAGRVVVSNGTGEWLAFARFETAEPSVAVSCRGGGEVRVAPGLDFDTFVGPLLVALIGGILLGGLGMVALIITTILWVTRRPAST